MEISKGDHCPICRGRLRLIQDGRRHIIECRNKPVSHYAIITPQEAAGWQWGESIIIPDDAFSRDPEHFGRHWLEEYAIV
jgi:hypothetical protein